MSASPTTAITFQNFFQATLTADITDTATDIFLDNVPNGTEGFLVIEPDSASKHEVIYYNSKTALKVTCPSAADGRGQDDTTAVAHSTGAVVIMAPVAAYFELLLSLFTTTPQGWTATGATVSAVTANGNRSYDLTVGTDITGTVSPGHRVRTTRTVAAPTQATSLNGTNQYWSKSSPAGMTFTDDFVAGAWVKLSAYPGSSGGAIISRFNGTSGWALQVTQYGQILLGGYNGGVANTSYVQSYQAIPLNKWVYVSAQLDMSAFTATTTTSYIMIDGVDVPASVTRGGTNPTALVQAGNLEVGTYNAGAFLSGKVAQAFVSSTKITQANIKTLYSQGLTSSLISTNNIISAYSFNGVATDLNTSNANDLTANGSATATNADSPFGGQAGGTISSTLDYGIVQKITASTVTIQVAEGCTVPTSGGVTSLYYSSYKSPFGFPSQATKWDLEVIQIAGYTAANNGGNISLHFALTVPVGEWDLGYDIEAQATTAAAATHNSRYSVSTTDGAAYDVKDRLTAQVTYVSITEDYTPVHRAKPLSVATQAPYYLNAGSVGANYTAQGLVSTMPSVMYARNAYL